MSVRLKKSISRTQKTHSRSTISTGHRQNNGEFKKLILYPGNTERGSSPRFYIISPLPDGIFKKKVIIKVSICDVLMVEPFLVVDPIQSYGETL